MLFTRVSKGSPVQAWGEDLRGYQTYGASPSEANTTDAEERQVKAIRPALDLGKDLAVML